MSIFPILVTQARSLQIKMVIWRYCQNLWWAEHEESTGVKAKDDPRFKKFFKMVQFGVPEPAVKLKMKNEGLDPLILE